QRVTCSRLFFFSSRRRHTRSKRDWSSDVCSSDLAELGVTYVYVSPPNYWGFQQPNEHLLELDATPGLAKVYSDSQVRIFAVRAAFSAAELRQVLESSPFPPDGRTPLTRATGVYGAE